MLLININLINRDAKRGQRESFKDESRDLSVVRLTCLCCVIRLPAWAVKDGYCGVGRGSLKHRRYTRSRFSPPLLL